VGEIRVTDLTRGQALITKGRAAGSFIARLRGLIGSRPLATGEGLLIHPCSSIHTHFMGYAIDVLYLNKGHEVVGIDEALAPWRLGRFYRQVRYVLELPAGAARANGVQVGDRLRVEGYFGVPLA
jgi:uncharacterized protein